VGRGIAPADPPSFEVGARVLSAMLLAMQKHGQNLFSARDHGALIEKLYRNAFAAEDAGGVMPRQCGWRREKRWRSAIRPVRAGLQAAGAGGKVRLRACAPRDGS